MSMIDGTWDSASRSPMGEQKSVMELKVDEAGNVRGSSQTTLGHIDIDSGRLEGDRLTLTMMITLPMPMTIEVDATVDGDTMSGNMKVGPLGSFPMTATRRAA